MFRFSPKVSLMFKKKIKKNGEFREMATLKAISIRLKSVKNIQKITQSMKMVSAAKYARAERDLKQVKPLGDGTKIFHDKVQIEKTEELKKTLFIAMTSDRGLCGAVHSSVAKVIRTSNDGIPDNFKIVCVGDKSRSLLQRLFSKNIILVGRLPPTFRDASKLALKIMESDFEYDTAKIIYNRFRSVVSYVTDNITFHNVELIKGSKNFKTYELEEDEEEETILSFLEFSIAALLFYSMKEGACSEQSSRMTAMDNASKNASEMINKLTLTFNRTRQAVITRELIEIISGASAL
ncbi:ATP synthase gamma chain isoform 2, putative [Pediculus humanus corporis]|uniref:ATP synthase subunit gamma n=1 Tax=Pediculus humanus subsp. corporis TaxID=121224 RepID=E0VFT3_PEDHC|nr:ATP synthase gamma chain isoform 2, putative [Pediculus humanus corporis]EEB12239.1 ATP synthase gamma chain isoform 2, putative [Pediculus humanus corporis]